MGREVVNIPEVLLVDDSFGTDVFVVPDGVELTDVMVNGATVSVQPVSFSDWLDVSQVLLVCVNPETSARLKD